MKLLKTITLSSVLLFFVLSFSQCSSSKKVLENAPVKVGEVYFQSWVGGVKGGGSGINVFIPIDERSQANFVLDSVYFRGKVAKLVTKTDKTLFIGRFTTASNQESDLIMTNKENGEYGNVVPSITGGFPFQLKDNECVVSYQDNSNIKYFKVENLSEKARVDYPSAPPTQTKQ
ncbi:hypothetical protein N7U66_13190 [Lacinutrix neustonica]|uniref:Lipoprotein n=1 Tax=Lacinutrix neustonica TaxID=2980107 RepID=A0A9E8SDE3_9FLAO|nr:hypothetical protein [Lacinutrix neustonica]WAC01114.1 hypothetical protein N7U66_13190 [Lacinutrix neustonica]